MLTFQLRKDLKTT